MDAVTAVSDELTELYLEGADIPRDLLYRVIRDETVGERMMPIFCGASLRNIGVQPLMDAIVDFLPAPQELPPIVGHHTKKDEDLDIKRSVDGQPLALVFKIQTDREAGNLSFIRVYSGSIKAGSAIYNVAKKKRERINRLLRIHANRTEQIDKVEAGDIAVVVGFKLAQTGDTIGSEGMPVLLERMHFPEPVISVAIEPKTLSEREKLKEVLRLLTLEDPTFFYTDNEDTGELIISGMGELHIDVLVTRIIEDFKVGAKVGNPQVTYRESISKEVSHVEKYHRVIGGKENAAEITLKVAPVPRGNGSTYESRVSKNKLPEHLQEAVRRGVEASFTSGIRYGYPATDLSVELVGARFDETSSTEFAYEAAASLGFDNACREASPILLEPIMRVDVMCPKEFLGDVISGITMRGGLVHGVESRVSAEHIRAEAPMANMFGYSTSLRSVTQGRGNYAMEFAHFAKKEESAGGR